MTTFRLLPVVAAALVVLGGACSDPPARDDVAERPDEEAELAHAQCMRDHGIDWPDPVFIDGSWHIRPGEGVDLESPAFIEAEAECARQRGDADPGPGDVLDPADRAELEQDMEEMLVFAQCMRDQGIDFADPQFDGSGGIEGPAGPADGDWDAFDAARRACEDQTGQPMP
jgi:hypothetical protein